jgi:hypothetical protein
MPPLHTVLTPAHGLWLSWAREACEKEVWAVMMFPQGCRVALALLSHLGPVLGIVWRCPRVSWGGEGGGKELGERGRRRSGDFVRVQGSYGCFLRKLNLCTNTRTWQVILVGTGGSSDSLLVALILGWVQSLSSDRFLCTSAPHVLSAHLPEGSSSPSLPQIFRSQQMPSGPWKYT